VPELPEVQTIVNQLEPDLAGKSILYCHLFWHKTLSFPPLNELLDAIRGTRITCVKRRGKYLIIELECGYLVFHLRMTGRMYLCPQPDGMDSWVRLSLKLGDESYLCFSDTRKFGRMYFTRTLDELELKLGPEPLTLQPEEWVQLFLNQSSGLKAFLLNQKKIAGLGNIYTDEVLFMSRLHPLKTAGSLRPAQARMLGRNIQTILESAIRHEGATISWYRKPDGTRGERQKHFAVYGKAGSPCPVCSHPMEKQVVAQRTTTFCPQCQMRS
jgi:formamidopyrimidine-DNA glycosylase